ncbi:hypothetical protein [Amycolatopsis pithecellobii]|uniref:hypothetical protein n=1 Tax=Amycolatopsis pithecellobii TaxID=664692 RepID=UPI001FEB5CE5|nr:hypothetical protein [Amycolatopsis pithecellobii]
MSAPIGAGLGDGRAFRLGFLLHLDEDLPPARAARAARSRGPTPTERGCGLMSLEFLWYIPNQSQPGHRGEPVTSDHNSLDTLTSHARALEEHGWGGALIGAGWGRPDT